MGCNLFDMKGNWKKKYFKNSNPLILELGCGKGGDMKKYLNGGV